MNSFKTRCPTCQAMNKVPTARISEVASCGKCQAPLFDGVTVEGTENNLPALLSSPIPVVIDFWAPWCNPCRSFSPVFEELANERKGALRFVKVDTQAQQMLAAKYQIRSIPTLMLFKAGKRIDMVNGALAKQQFSAWLNNAIQK